MTAVDPPVEGSEPLEGDAAVPTWEDPYLESVARRLASHYDLERGCSIDGERFALSGELHVAYERHAVHPSLSFGHHEAHEYLFATRLDRPTVGDLEALAALGEWVAEERAEPDPEHYSTDVTFAVIAEGIPDAVAEYVEGYRNRTLLTYGYNGHTEVNLLVVAPDRETCVASAAADVADAFCVWEPIERSEPGRLERLLGWLSR